MDHSYHLLSTSGIDVIIIPELDCRINIVDPVKNGIDLQKGEQIIFVTIVNRKLAFQAVGLNCPGTKEIAKAAHWYSSQKNSFN